MTQIRRFRGLYGAGPLHLLALIASFAIAAAAVVGWFQRPREVVNVLEWFVAAILIHDLVLLPLYSLLDRIAFGRQRERADRARHTTILGRVTPTPYLRIPAILSGLLLVVFFPVIFGLGTQTELFASGIPETGYLARWLLATGVMFAVSGIAYAAAVARVRASLERDESDLEQTAPEAEEGAPEPDQTAPEAEEGAPEPDHTVTEAEEAAPEPDQTVTEAEEAAPEPDHTVTEAEEAAPEPDQTAPEPDHTAPEPDQTAPDDAAARPPASG
jgi:hypothetical protein